MQELPKANPPYTVVALLLQVCKSVGGRLVQNRVAVAKVYKCVSKSKVFLDEAPGQSPWTRLDSHAIQSPGVGPGLYYGQNADCTYSRPCRNYSSMTIHLSDAEWRLILTPPRAVARRQRVDSSREARRSSEMNIIA